MDQIIEAGCHCIVKVYSNYENFKMLVEVVLRRPEDDGDFEVAHKAPCDVLGFDTDLSQQGPWKGVHDGGTASLAF